VTTGFQHVIVTRNQEKSVMGRGIISAAKNSATIGTWMCEHRDPVIANMLAFRRAVAGTAQTNWWDDGGNAIAFSREGRGFVAINHETAPVSHNFVTGLPAGTYCDVLGGGIGLAGCVGQTITVGVDGKANVTL
jgi:alpha-amylase